MPKIKVEDFFNYQQPKLYSVRHREAYTDIIEPPLKKIKLEPIEDIVWDFIQPLLKIVRESGDPELIAQDLFYKYDTD